MHLTRGHTFWLVFLVRSFLCITLYSTSTVYGHVHVSVHLSFTSRYCVDIVEQFKLVFDIEACRASCWNFDISKTNSTFIWNFIAKFASFRVRKFRRDSWTAASVNVSFVGPMTFTILSHWPFSFLYSVMWWPGCSASLGFLCCAYLHVGFRFCVFVLFRV